MKIIAKKAYTLLEIIFVVMLVSLSLVLAMPYTHQARVNYESKVMLRNVMQRFEYELKNRMLSGGSILMRFSANKVYFLAEQGDIPTNENTYIFPKEAAFTYEQLTLNQFGHVGAQTIHLNTPTRHYAVVFQLGSGGKYRYAEERK